MTKSLLLASLCALGLVTIASCGAGSDGSTQVLDGSAPDADERPPTPTEWDRAVTRVPEAQAAASRAACRFERGTLADESLGSEIPVGADIPIDTIVILMQENRSFDSYFGHFGKYAGRTDVESSPEDATNPEDTANPASPKHPYRHGAHLCFADTDHSWAASHRQWNNGKNDGFFQTNDGASAPRDGERALWWYDERDIPFYYALAKEFGIADHYHAALMGPTWPNRMYLVAGTSYGVAANYFPDLSAYSFPDNDAIIFDELEKRHVDWDFYTGGGPPGASTLLGSEIISRYGIRHPVNTIEVFEQEAAAGTLPSVVFLDANFLKEGDPLAEDEHPPADIQAGQKFTWRIVNALTKSPQWRRSALFITYDEHGGIFDHVPPPPACAPDALPPQVKKGINEDGAFDHYGFRVPLTVVSPYSKRGFVSHATYDHTSLLRFVQARFRVPALSARDANALVPMDFFDFANPPHLDVPAFPEPTIDPAETEYCTHAGF